MQNGPRLRLEPRRPRIPCHLSLPHHGLASTSSLNSSSSHAKSSMHVGVIRVRRYSLQLLPPGAVAKLIGKTRSCDRALACERDAFVGLVALVPGVPCRKFCSEGRG